MKQTINKKQKKILIFFTGEDPLNIPLVFAIVADFSEEDKASFPESPLKKKDVARIESIMTRGRSGKGLQYVKSILETEKPVIEKSKRTLIRFIECGKGCQACPLFAAYLTTATMRIKKINRQKTKNARPC